LKLSESVSPSKKRVQQIKNILHFAFPGIVTIGKREKENILSPKKKLVFGTTLKVSFLKRSEQAKKLFTYFSRQLTFLVITSSLRQSLLKYFFSMKETTDDLMEP
jgi:hypothetical protein